MSRSGWMCALALASVAAAGAVAGDAKPSAKERMAKQIAVLRSEAPLEQKHQACRQLAQVGDAGAVAVLAGLLSDAKLSHMARYALEPMPDAAAGKALRDALGSLKGTLLAGVVHSVGMREDAQAVAALSGLARGQDADVAAAAMEALGRIATPEAAKALAALRTSAPDALRRAVADASLRAAGKLARRDNAKQAVAIFQELRAAKWPPHVRLGAFTGLLAAAPDEAPAAIMEALAGNDRLLRATAIAQIPHLEGKSVAARFAAELPKTPPDVQVLLMRALAGRTDAKATLRPVATNATGSPHAEVRAAAVEALGTIGDADSVPVLFAVLTKGGAGKQAAAASLRALAGDTVDAAIVACMKKAPPAARPDLIAVLADRKATGAIDELLHQAMEPHAATRSAAFKALAQLATAERLPALIGALTALNGNAGRRDAERAVVQISRKLAENQSAPALAALKKAADPAARNSLLSVLGAIGDDAALQAVQAATAASDAATRDTALRALADWPDPRPLPTLLELFRTTANPTHRVLALRGCVRLLGLGEKPAGETLKVYADLAARAKRPEDRKLVLSGLAKVADPAAFAAIEPFLADAATRNEAELALVSVARAVMGVAPSEATAVAKRLAAESKNKAVRGQAAGVLRATERLADYVTAWQMAGPYEQAGKDGAALIDIAFPPEKPTAKGVAWRILPIATAGPQPWMFQFQSVFGGENRACYIRTWLHPQKAGAARLEFGADDGSKVWVNGKVVHADGTGGAATPGEHKVKVMLVEGWNVLLVKVTQYTGPWQFCLRVRDEKGDHLPGLRVRATPPLH